MTSDNRSVSAQAQKYNTSAPNGFAEPNYTQIPNEFLDNWLPSLTGAETKVALYIFRRTLGFRRRADSIGLTQICAGLPAKDRGTGLHRETALNAINGLCAKGFMSAKRNGKRRTVYSLNVHEAPPLRKLVGKSDQLESTQTGRKIRPELVGKSDQNWSENPTTQKKGNTGKESVVVGALARLAQTCRATVPSFDDDAVRSLWRGCRKLAPHCTADEVAEAFHSKAGQVLRGKAVRNPVGLLLKAVPKCFEGGKPIHAGIREQPAEQQTARNRMFAQEILRSPEADEEQREWARSILDEAAPSAILAG